MVSKTDNIVHYTGSILYEIELTAKYCKMLGAQIFEQYNVDINMEEFIVLDILLCNQELCQRDVAKMIVKDRANTGKLLDNLEKKGLIERTLTVKNKRTAKMVRMTNAGLEKVNEVSLLLKEYLNTLKQTIQNHNLGEIKNSLKDLRNVLKESVDIQI